MVRISDGRMSGTGFGTVVLHVSPEAASGGNFSVVESGDIISLDVKNRSLHVELSEAELNARKAKHKASHKTMDRGYVGLYQQHVQQAHQGADFDFLVGMSGSEVTRDSH